MINRTIAQITSPKAALGFLGEGHIAVPVIDSWDANQTNPFILLMDDQLDLPGNEAAGGAHPHAGFEIVTLILEGQTGAGAWSSVAGDMEWLTAGSGVVHTEEIKSRVKLRILQLWLQLPSSKIWMEPKWQKASLQSIPVKKTGNSEIRIYSGTAFGLTAPVLNEIPVLILHFTLAPHDEVNTVLPASYRGLIYMLNGEVIAGDTEALINKQQAAWLNSPVENGDSHLKLKGGKAGAELVLYAAKPQGTQIFSKGPFIADKQEDFPHLYHKFNTGKMPHVNDLPKNRLFHY